MELKYIQKSTWIRDSLHIIGHKTLFDLTLPGSHDTAAFKFRNAVMPGTTSNFVEFLISASGSLIDKNVIKMEQTQELDTYNQLLAGARYLDIRVGWLNNEWITYHCHVCETLENVLNDISKFLDNHDHEIVIIEISHFKSPDTQNVHELYRIIENSIGKHMHPVVDELDFTIIDMIERNKRAIVALSKYFDPNFNLWSNKFIKNTYPDENEIKEVRNYNKRLIREPNTLYKNKLLKISWILTPSLKQFSKSLLKIAVDVNHDMHDTYSKMVKKDQNIRFGNILIVDNFDKSEIMKIIYKMNGIIL